MNVNNERPAGFLGFTTNWFDRVFISGMVLVAMHLIWLRFLEPLNLSLWICTALSLVIGVIIFRRG